MFGTERRGRRAGVSRCCERVDLLERWQQRLWAGTEEVWSTGEEFKVSLFWESGGRGSRRSAGRHGREVGPEEGTVGSHSRSEAPPDVEVRGQRVISAQVPLSSGYLYCRNI